MAVSKAEIEQLIGGEHADPHRVLGAHPVKTGVRIRAYRPEAESVLAIVPGADEQTVKLRRTHPAGLFEGTVKGAQLPLSYELEVAYPEGRASGCVTRTRSCRCSASSTCTSSARAGTSSCTSGSVRTRARSTAWRGPRSPSGHRPRGR